MSGLASLLPKPKNVEVVSSGDLVVDAETLISEETRASEETQISGEIITTTAGQLTETTLTQQSKYDQIAHIGHGPDRLVQTQLSDLKPKYLPEEALLRPTPEQIAEETESARQALQLLVREKTARTQPKSFSANRDTEMLRYTGKTGGERMVKMVEMPVDPLQPPKFHHKRIPRAPPSPPAPRLHSPPRKVTADEQRAWHVPPCISSWKNPKGYTVPLDKRLAADGRGLEEKTINSRVSDLAEALFLAEKHNREEVEMRSVVERKVQQQEARKRDEQLRLLAEKAREEARNLAEDIERAARHEESLLGGTVDTGLGLTVREREQIRKDRAYEREREMRLSRLPPEQRARLADRDISERIALGTAQPEKETLFDQRLFDQSSGVGAGMGGGEDELYSLYDRPLFAGSAMHMIYKPQSQPSRAEKAFSGTEGVAVREGPVQFEKAPEKTTESADPFGVEQFLSEAKRGKRTKNE